MKQRFKSTHTVNITLKDIDRRRAMARIQELEKKCLTIPANGLLRKKVVATKHGWNDYHVFEDGSYITVILLDKVRKGEVTKVKMLGPTYLTTDYSFV